jgi:hypothetical protein
MRRGAFRGARARDRRRQGRGREAACALDPGVAVRDARARQGRGVARDGAAMDDGRRRERTRERDGDAKE